MRRNIHCGKPLCPWHLAMLLLALLPLFAGCPGWEIAYHVNYEGNNQTEGYPPVDSTAYAPGAQITVLDKPAGLKKGSLEFLGWRQIDNDTLLQGGDRITIDYSDIWLYAWWGDDPDNNPYAYTLNSSGEAVITKYFPYNYPPSIIVIPKTLDDFTVTGIGEGAFVGVYLHSVTLPETLQVIGNKAFAGNWINRLVIPDSVISIGKLAFQNGALETLILGAALESIDDYAFDGNRLKVLFLPGKVVSIGEGAFSENALESIEIGENVDIKGDTSLGMYGALFRTYYADKGKSGGVYLYKNDAWQGPYTK